MRGKFAERSVIGVNIARIFLYKLPERFYISKTSNIVNRGIGFLFQASREDSDNYILRRSAA